MKKNKMKILSIMATAFFAVSMVSTANASTVTKGTGSSIGQTMLKLQKAQSSKNTIKGKYQTFNENETSKVDPESDVRLIIELDEKSAKDYVKTGELKQAAKDSSIINKVNTVQKSYVSKVLKVDNNIKVVNNYNLLLNGFSVQTKYKNIDKIANIDGVSKVSVANEYHPTMNNAKSLANLQAVYEQYGFKGEGTVVAIVDSGIDPSHKDMTITDESKVKIKTQPSKGDNGKYFTVKVPYGYNFADKNTDIVDVNPGVGMHGMHVAGIVAANCQSEEEIKNNAGVRGVAPEAQLLAMKVFSNNPNFKSAFSDDIVAAIESSVAHGADVINMSLGSDSGFQNEEDPETKAVTEASKQGVLCVISAGNSEYSTAPYKFNTVKDIAVVGSPGLSEKSLCVASYENNTMTGPAIEYSYEENGSTVTKNAYYTLSELSPVGVLNEKGYEIVNCGRGTVEEIKGKDLSGKVALIQRGGNTFVDKKANAQKAGAVGAIIYNNTVGYLNMATDPSITIPSILISKADGEAMVANADKGLKVAFTDKVIAIDNGDAGDMSDFTSWGCTPNLELKPEISGVGGDIWSTVNANQYESMSGTSMASPFVAGVEALMMQRINGKDININNENRIDVIKNLTVAAAKPQKGATSGDTYFSPRRQGAGLVDAKAAINNDVTVTYNNKPVASIKEISNLSIFEVTLKNYGKVDATYKVKDLCGGVLTEQNKEVLTTMTYDTVIKGSKVAFDKDTVTVKAGKTATVKVILSIPRTTEKDIFAEGFIGFESQTKGVESVGIPYMGFYGDWAGLQIIDAPVWDENSTFGMTSLVSVTGEDGPAPLGVVGVNKYGAVIDPEAIAISTNNNSAYTNVMPSLWLLRNVKTQVIEVLDSNHNVIRKLSVDENIRKCLFDGGQNKEKSAWIWDGTVYDNATGTSQPVKDGQYYISVKNTVDYKDAKAQTLEMPVKVDSVAPVVNQISNEWKDGAYRIVFTAEDGKDASGVKEFEGFGFTVDGETYTDEDGNSLISIEKNDEGQYVIDLNIPEGDHEVVMTVFDNAGNMTETVIGENASTESLSVEFDNLVAGDAINTLGRTITGKVTSMPIQFTIAGNKVKVNSDLTFACPVNFVEGLNKIAVYAKGADGEVINYSVTVYVDITAPTINVTSSKANEEVNYIYVPKNASTYELKGTIKDNLFGYKLYINDENIFSTAEDMPNPNQSARKFEKTITLADSRTVVTIQAIDEIGNFVTRQLIIIKK